MHLDPGRFWGRRLVSILHSGRFWRRRLVLHLDPGRFWRRRLVPILHSGRFWRRRLVRKQLSPTFVPWTPPNLSRRRRASRGSGCWPSRMAPARCRRLHAPLRPSPRHRGRQLGATFVILDSLLTATPSDGRQPRGQRRGSAAASGRRNHDVRHRRRGNELAVRLRCASRRDAATTPPPPLQPAPPHPLPQRLSEASPAASVARRPAMRAGAGSARPAQARASGRVQHAASSRPRAAALCDRRLPPDRR